MHVSQIEIEERRNRESFKKGKIFIKSKMLGELLRIWLDEAWLIKNSTQ